jgi:septal ring factor EnvC (AmiA/AmiB activator)
VRAPRRLAALALTACLLAPGVAPADRREELEALRRAIRESRERVAAYESEARGLLETLEALDRAAVLLARDVARARQGAREARSALVAIEAQTQRLATRLEATRRTMRSRSVALYRAGELGSVRLLFSADGLPEFLARVSTLRRLLDRDAELLDRYRAESAALREAEAEARATAERLALAERELAGRSEELAVERAARRRLASRLHADRTRERSALVELEKAARALEETLERLGSEAPAPRSFPGPPFLTLRRHLEPPVDAPVTRSFGRLVDVEFLTETFHSGVVFEAERGTPVHAVAAGQVRFADWFRGYGRMVILDHGDGYFTVSGHLDEIRVRLDDVVQARQVIGSVGDTGSLAGPRLYFEVRKGGEPQDPADWLRHPGAG